MTTTAAGMRTITAPAGTTDRRPLAPRCPVLFASRNDEEVMVFGTLGCGALLMLGLFLVVIFYLIGMTKALQACGPRERMMAPGLVWLSLGPVINLFWPLWSALQVGESLRREFRARGLRADGSFGKPTGVMAHLLGVFAPCLNVGGFAAAMAANDREVSPMIFFTSNAVGNLLALIYLLLVILHWVQVAGYTRTLNSARGHREYDDRPRRRGEEEYDRRDEFDEDYRPRRMDD